MPEIIEFTDKLGLPLPNKANRSDFDAMRINEALRMLDGWVAAGGSFSPNDHAADFPTVGDESVLYLAKDTGRLYRWTGAVYVAVGSPESSDDVPEGATNKYFTDARARAAQQPATAAALGVVRIGSGLSVGLDGVLSAVGGGSGSGVPAFNELPLTVTSNGQKNFTVTDGYTVGNLDVYLNGVLLHGNGDDYTASNGTTVVLTTGINTTDSLVVRRWTTSNNLPFSALLDPPTTLAGYGITDAASDAELAAAIGTAVLKTGDQTVDGVKTFNNPAVFLDGIRAAPQKRFRVGGTVYQKNLNTGNTNWVVAAAFIASNVPMYTRFLLTCPSRHYAAEIVFSKATAGAVNTTARIRVLGAYQYFGLYPVKFRIVDLGTNAGSSIDFCFSGTSASTESYELFVMEDYLAGDRSAGYENFVTYPLTAGAAFSGGYTTNNTLTVGTGTQITYAEARLSAGQPYAAVVEVGGAIGQTSMESNNGAAG